MYTLSISFQFHNIFVEEEGERLGVKMRKIKLAMLIAGLSTLVLTGCGNTERKETVEEILALQKAYVEAEENISEDNRQEYVVLGESILALVEIADKDSGQLETEEEIEEAKSLVDEFHGKLNEMVITIEEVEVTEVNEEEVEFSISFQNGSTQSYASLSVLDPKTGREMELDSFESGKKIETTLKVSVEELKFKWYLYNQQGESVLEEETDLIDAKEGVIVYCMDDGVYIEYY